MPYSGYTNVRILLQSALKLPYLSMVPMDPTRLPL